MHLYCSFPQVGTLSLCLLSSSCCYNNLAGKHQSTDLDCQRQSVFESKHSSWVEKFDHEMLTSHLPSMINCNSPRRYSCPYCKNGKTVRERFLPKLLPLSILEGTHLVFVCSCSAQQCLPVYSWTIFTVTRKMRSCSSNIFYSKSQFLISPQSCPGVEH